VENGPINAGNGAHRGAELSALFRAIGFQSPGNSPDGVPPGAFGGFPFSPLSIWFSDELPIFSSLPPGSFGGDDYFTEEQKDMICDAQDMIARHPDRSRAVNGIAAILRNLFGFEPHSEGELYIRNALRNAAFCED
jgi:hypothetical protein